MKSTKSFGAQRGAILVMGLIVLAILMLSVSVAFLMSNNNLRAVGNMQSRAEAVAAADAAVEKLISSDAIFLSPAVTTLPADDHGVAVTIAAPVCVKFMALDAGNSADATPNIYQEDVTLTVASGYLETDWDISTTASNGATSAKVETHQGIKIILPADPNPCL